MFFTLVSAAAADTARCRASVNGQERLIEYDTDIDFGTQRSLRERLTALPGRSWSRAWGEPVACDSRVLFAFLAVELPPEEVEGWCLATDPDDAGWLLVPGERGASSRCSVAVCDRITAAASEAAGAAAHIGAMALGAQPQEDPEEGRSLMHSTGAAVMRGSARYLAANIVQGSGTLASGLGTAMAAPAAIGAAAASVVVVGGAVYYCSG